MTRGKHRPRWWSMLLLLWLVRSIASKGSGGRWSVIHAKVRRLTVHHALMGKYVVRNGTVGSTVRNELLRRRWWLWLRMCRWLFGGPRRLAVAALEDSQECLGVRCKILVVYCILRRLGW